MVRKHMSSVACQAIVIQENIAFIIDILIVITNDDDEYI